MEEDLVQIYSVVEAKSVNELVRLTNLKTKQGWNCLGGMCYAPLNICEADSQSYQFCQSIYRMEKPKAGKEPGKFVAFPYKGKKEKDKNHNHKNKKYAPRHTSKD